MKLKRDIFLHIAAISSEMVRDHEVFAAAGDDADRNAKIQTQACKSVN